ncbi:MAG: hydrogenase 3 maturation endopeptidase HyCI [Sedimentisphaerales bacterium]|nr:hydrogenase 3 maturation endopeptidase HyCI [Sedimentisphaerales bacterium]
MQGLDSLREILSTFEPSKTLILCVGNTLKGDDGAGPVLYEKLKGKVGCILIDAGTVPENYIQRIIDAAVQNILLVDAVDFGGTGGEVRLFKDDEIPRIAFSTHVLSPTFFIEAVKTQCSAAICLIGIQPVSIAINQQLSESVLKAIDNLAELFLSIYF